MNLPNAIHLTKISNFLTRAQDFDTLVSISESHTDESIHARVQTFFAGNWHAITIEHISSATLYAAMDAVQKHNGRAGRRKSTIGVDITRFFHP